MDISPPDIWSRSAASFHIFRVGCRHSRSVLQCGAPSPLTSSPVPPSIARPSTCASWGAPAILDLQWYIGRKPCENIASLGSTSNRSAR
eukprot:scaffold294658_cov33-Tisochrysis_lutea.AAC.2